MLAHQKIIRDRRRDTDADADIFGQWWKSIDVDIGKAVVREIDYSTAATVIEAYEWLGCMPAVVWYSFGIYYERHLAGVACYGPEYSENLGVWDKYGYTGRMILLSRGACVHWAHKHSGSKLIRESMRMLPAKYEVVTATTDSRAGEVGTIYQACGFVYAKMDTHTRSGAVINGKLVGSRAIRQRMGTSTKEDIRAMGGTVEIENQKGRYFAFRGSAKSRKAHLAAIAHLVRPYPKRAAEASGEYAPDQRESVGRFHAAAP